MNPLASGPGERRSSGQRKLAAIVLALLALWAAAAPWCFPAGPLAPAAPPLLPPGAAAWLGSDDLGRSLAALLAYGLQTSFLVAGGTLAISLVLGLGFGLAAGVYGGVIDEVLMRVSEAFQVLPRTLLAIVVIALFEPGLGVLILVLGLTSWSGLARWVRASTRAASGSDFVLALRSLGASRRWIARRHLLRHALTPVAAAAGNIAAGALLAEAALGFVGLGDAQTTSLGRQIAEAFAFAGVAPWMAWVPGLGLLVLVLAIHALCAPEVLDAP